MKRPAGSPSSPPRLVVELEPGPGVRAYVDSEDGPIPILEMGGEGWNGSSTRDSSRVTAADVFLAARLVDAVIRYRAALRERTAE